MERKRQKRFLHRGNLRDGVFFLSLISAFFFPADKVNTLIALALLTLGILLNFLTKGTLIREAILCDKGVYRLCRHPYYLSNFIIDSSICLLSGNIYLVLAYPFLFFWAYGPTFEEEETFLSRKFSEQRDHYLLERPQVFPCETSLVSLHELLKEVSLRRITRTEIIRILRFWTVAIALLMIHECVERSFTVFIHSNDYKTLIPGLFGVLLGISSILLPWLKSAGDKKICRQ